MGSCGRCCSGRRVIGLSPSRRESGPEEASTDLSFPLGGRIANRARRVVQALRGRAVILLYHRVGPTDLDPWDLAVSPAHFSEHLAVLRERARPIALSRVLRGEPIPRNAVVVTFDDGYADNLENARPLLDRFETPATVFLTVAKLGTAEAFWWDELAEIFLRPGRLPAALAVEVRGQTYSWDLGDSAAYDEGQANRERAWRGWYERKPTPRHKAFSDLSAVLRSLGDPQRVDLMARLRSWASTNPLARPFNRILDRDEAGRLAEGDLVEVGCHTKTHSRLADLNGPEKRDEIGGGRRTLEELSGRPVTSFAYPFGQSGDYDAESVAIVRESGFEVACVNSPGLVSADSDPYEMPRQYVSDWDGDEFARRWTAWHRV